MTHARLGRSGLSISRLCLGTLNFGPETSEADSFAIMDRAAELGINFFDTANVYGWEEGKGATETIIGNWLAQGGRRDRIVLASKVFMQTGDGPNDGGLSAYHIRKACDDSLTRLRTDHIDLYQMHHIDRAAPWEEIWQAMETLVRQGKILYVGSSNFAGWHIAQAQAAAAARNFMGIVSEQGLYSLCYRHSELEVIPACRAHGVGFLPWGTLNRGFLAGSGARRHRGQKATERLKREYERFGGRLPAYVALCREAGESPADVAFAWTLHNPAVPAVIIGPRTIGQLESSLHCLDIRLDESLLVKLNELWPSPGGEALEGHRPR
ncbi:aldo/keto reductase [bacterium]|nr:aldo/keto reductase [bacterium]